VEAKEPLLPKELYRPISIETSLLKPHHLPNKLMLVSLFFQNTIF